MARVKSVMDDELLRRLRYVLVDEKISLSEWIRRQAVAYVALIIKWKRKRIKDFGQNYSSNETPTRPQKPGGCSLLLESV